MKLNHCIRAAIMHALGASGLLLCLWWWQWTAVQATRPKINSRLLVTTEPRHGSSSKLAASNSQALEIGKGRQAFE